MKRFIALLLSLLMVGGNAFALTVNGELKKAQLENQTSDPTCTATQEGRVYWNSSTNLGKICTGSAWETLVNTATAMTNVMDSAGDMVYGGAAGVPTKLDSGTSGQWLVSGGAATPAWTNTVTTAKVIDGSADAVQLTVQGHSTQTNDILLAEKSDGTDVLNVTNVNGTKIRGTTTNDNAATGFVGEFDEVSVNLSGKNQLNTGTPENLSGGTIDLTAGDWEIYGQIAFDTAATTRVREVAVGISLTTGTFPASSTIFQPDIATGEFSTQLDWVSTMNFVPDGELYLAIGPYRVSTTTTRQLFIVVSSSFTISNLYAYGYVQARRIR